MPAKIPDSLIRLPDSWLWLLTPASCQNKPGQVAGMALQTGFLPPTKALD